MLEKAGLVLSGNSGMYDRFRGRLMFTLCDHKGNVVGFSGRVLDPAIKEAKYINTSETPVYSKSNVLYGLDVTHDAIVKAGEAILMEGEIDLISSFQVGISNVVAIKGSALTEGHVHLLKRYTERVIFALDSDMAGDKAARRGIDVAEGVGLDMRVAIMPIGKDPDEAAREDEVGLKKALKNAIPIYDYFIESAKKRFDLTSAFGKQKASEELLPILSKIENGIVQGHYIKKAAVAFDVPEDVVVDGIKKVKKPIEMIRGSVADTKESSFAISGPERLELYALGLLLQGDTKKLYADFSRGVTTASLKHMGVRRVMEHIDSYLKQDTAFVVSEFAEILPKELLPVLDEAYLWDISTIIDDPDAYQKEWNKILKEVQKSIIRRNMRDVTEKIKLSKDIDTNVLQQELVKLTEAYTALEKQ
ncbi:MAG: primase protein [Microgenomates group bacterium GW2011_GWC1_39_12]|nr:MAG: primase protein [Microgenomates group bacterium GW2011_GWC1_39_12]